MKEILIAKFHNTPLMQRLLNTKDAYLIEGNQWHDNFWGICIKSDCPKCQDSIGHNNLGLLLMELRGILNGNFKVILGKELV